jgi:hypothetical protein
VTGSVADRDPYGNRHADDKANSLKSDSIAPDRFANS